MPFAEDLLMPIDGPNPAGVPVRNTPIFEKIKEARTQDENLPAGDWERERKVANYSLVIKLAEETIAKQSKDLQLAAWLTEASLYQEGFGGLYKGLQLCLSLIEQFWESVYPAPDEGDLELRAAPLNWIGLKLDTALKTRPLVTAGYDWYQFKDSRIVGYENQINGDNERKKRDAMLAAGKLAPEEFDKAFANTPKGYYLQAEADLDGSLDLLHKLAGICDEKFADTAPSFSTLERSLEEVRQSIHALLEKKRETEPDPALVIPAASAGDLAPAGLSSAMSTPRAENTPATLIIPLASSEPPERRDAIAAIASHAASFRKRDPFSPAPYLMMRGLRWGELRAAAETSDSSWLEAPPTEVRRHIKSLAIAGRWAELLEAAENVMSLPCSRAWLDLQRFVVEACVELGPQYHGIANAIRSELRCLIRDVPQLLQATLMDDTPAANPGTQSWIRELVEETNAPNGGGPAWEQKLQDSYAVAMEAFKAGNTSKAIQVLSKDIENQRSGRGRFQRKLQLVELCISCGKSEIAQPVLDDLIVSIQEHKLDEWEEPEVVARALEIILKSSRKVQEDSSEQARLFERICRLDPVRALGL